MIEHKLVVQPSILVCKRSLSVKDLVSSTITVAQRSRSAQNLDRSTVLIAQRPRSTITDGQKSTIKVQDSVLPFNSRKTPRKDPCESPSPSLYSSYAISALPWPLNILNSPNVTAIYPIILENDYKLNQMVD